MLGRELLVALAHGERLGGLHEAPRPFGEFIEIHMDLLDPRTRPEAAWPMSAIRPPQAALVQM